MPRENLLERLPPAFHLLPCFAQHLQQEFAPPAFHVRWNRRLQLEQTCSRYKVEARASDIYLGSNSARRAQRAIPVHKSILNFTLEPQCGWIAAIDPGRKRPSHDYSLSYSKRLCNSEAALKSSGLRAVYLVRYVRSLRQLQETCHTKYSNIR